MQDFRDLTDEELQQRLQSLRQELLNLRLQVQVGQLENPARIRVVRRDIARAVTLKTERARQRAE
jgi:large subunit ribosomal protein L29